MTTNQVFATHGNEHPPDPGYLQKARIFIY